MFSNCGSGEDSQESLGDWENKLVNLKGNQPWIFTGRIDTKTEAPIFWPPDVKSWLTGKELDAGKGWRQKVKGAAEDEMVRQHHQPNEHAFDQTLGDSERQRSLAWCSPCSYKESDTTEQLNWLKSVQMCEAYWYPRLTLHIGRSIWATLFNC